MDSSEEEKLREVDTFTMREPFPWERCRCILTTQDHNAQIETAKANAYRSRRDRKDQRDAILWAKRHREKETQEGKEEEHVLQELRN